MAGELDPAESIKFEAVVIPAAVSIVKVLPFRNAASLAKVPETVKVITSADARPGVSRSPTPTSRAIAAENRQFRFFIVEARRYRALLRPFPALQIRALWPSRAPTAKICSRREHKISQLLSAHSGHSGITKRACGGAVVFSPLIQAKFYFYVDEDG